VLDPPYAAFRDALEPELVELLRALAEGLDHEAASFGPERRINEDIRRAEVGFFPREHWTSGLFFHFGLQANNKAWHFDVRAVGAVQVAAYREGGHYRWHTDSGGPAPEGFQRKLTVVAPLSNPDDYEGGKLELQCLSEGGAQDAGLVIAEAAVPGSIVVFPAFTPHRVTPVTRGVRRSIVAWLIGQPLR
jgi:PKHD-type hydroxylase